MRLKGSPATFQRLMDMVLTGLKGVKCLKDDIVIYGSSFSDHNAKLKEVFQRLRENNLKIQPTKCKFLCKEVTYLGHVISETEIKPDPQKNEVVKIYPKPKNRKE